MKFFFFWILFFNTTLTFAAIKEEINQYIKANHFKDKNLGLLIVGDDKTIYELNSKKLMIPASLTKIFTAGAVLKSMPMNTHFQTQLLSNGKIFNGTLNGNICLKGGGDPSFVSEKMWFLVNELTREEFKKIEGDVVIDASKFDDELIDSGRDSIRVDRAFDAPVSAMSFNWNSINVFIRPSEKIGLTAKVFTDPGNNYIELENKTTTGSESSKKSINVQRLKVGDHDKILVTGSIPKNSNEIVFYKSITNPNLWSGEHLLQFLKQRNIEVTGKIKIGKCEMGSNILASVDSKNLNEILSDMLKFSNNFVAEMLAKNLGAMKKNETPAKMQDGILEIKKFIEVNNIAGKDYVLENVSGLTRGNQFSAQEILNALTVLKNDFQIFPEFLAGLPLAGVDGTLKNRFKKDDESLVRAKTGYLDGVVGLAGYIGRKNKQPLIFVFMYNGEYEQGLEARKLFDGIIERVKKWD
jgi:D-alanyl-D-alanine carboxypeptidase/D-alanyl-D-alanine-endopeptidase (penicillin-binding protein 4)